MIIEPAIIETEFVEVMSGPMMERSGNSAFSNLAKSVSRTVKVPYDKSGGPSPTVVADTISNAITNNKPKNRYATGKLAKPMLFLRKYLIDKTFD